MKTGHQEASLAEQSGAFAQEIRQSMLISLRGHREGSTRGKAYIDNTLVRPKSMARFN